MSFTYSHPRPMVTADTVLMRGTAAGLEVLLIKRKNEPHTGSWALPGGFVDMDEELEIAAARELAEETGVTDVPLEQFHAFGKVGRDPRGRSITIGFVGMLQSPDTSPTLQAGDDAADAQWFPITNLPETAFDHTEIIDTALSWLHSEGYL